MLLNLNIDPYKVDDYFNILEKNDILDPREKVYRKLGDDLKKMASPMGVLLGRVYFCEKRYTN